MNQKNSYQKQRNLSIVSFIYEIPNVIAVMLSAIVSNSILTWLDFVDSLGKVVSDGLIVIQSRKMSHDLKYEYNYGVGKLEAITTFFCQSIEIGGLLCVIIISIMEIIHPEKPSDLLIYVVGLKVINILVDGIFVYQQNNINQENPSTVTESELFADIGEILFDVVTFISILIAWILRSHPVTWYISPILSILISIFLLYICSKHIRHVIHELTDHTLPEEIQLLILKAISQLNDSYHHFGSINSHHNGVYVDVDICVEFLPETTYEEIEQFRHKIQKELEKDIQNCRVSLLIKERMEI